jgi:hypothetical protein
MVHINDGTWKVIRQGPRLRPLLGQHSSAVIRSLSQKERDGVRLLEIVSHPVLKAYVEQCEREPISLIRRTNSKAIAQAFAGHGKFPQHRFQNVSFDTLYTPSIALKI